MVIRTTGGVDLTRLLFTVCTRNVSAFSKTKSSASEMFTHCVLLVRNVNSSVSESGMKSSLSVV